MKTLIIFLITAFIASLSNSYAQEQTIRLKLEEGHTFFFKMEIIQSEFDNEKQYLESITTRKFRFSIESVNSNKIVFSSILLSGNYEQPNARVKSLYNVKFPPVVDNINQRNSFIEVFSSLLSLVKIKYEIDLINNIVRQINKEEMLQAMQSILKRKGYTDEFILKFVSFVKEENEAIRMLLSYNEILLYFNNASKNHQGKIYSSFLNKNFIDLDIENGNAKAQKYTTPSNSTELVKLKAQYGFISEYYSVKRDSVKAQWSRIDSSLTETKIQYLYSLDNQSDSLIFHCTIENPKDSIVTLLYYEKPFGKNFTHKHIRLDKNNSVKAKVNLPEQAFVMFSANELVYPVRAADFVFYADPGDTIMLKIKNENDFQEVEISGTNNKINTILYNMGKNLGLFSPEYVSFKTSTFSTTIEEYKWADQALDIFRNHLKENSIEVTQRVISFIENEMTAMEFLNYYLVANLNLRDFRQSVIKENEKVKYAKQRIQNFDLHDVYNNYGYFSRRLADSYLAYYLNQLPRIDGNEKSVRQGKTITEEFFRAKLILGGDLFYQTMAGRIEHLVTRQFSVVSNTDFTELENAIVLINQLKNQSYDSHFFEALANFRDNRLKWETDFYVPEVELYQKNGQKIVLKEIIKGKPTILYIHRDWSRHRYYWDELAQKYPRIRFVFVMEGNNLKKWQDYLRQAEPVAEQYLLNAEENSLENVFMRSNQMYIVYGKNGELLDFDVNEEKAIQLAKENLEQKNEPDKSQLITIIVILGSLLFISLLVFILWRWRTRQRLRKEQQQRRLRELELTAIRSQMNPHFLFNCLNSVQNLVQQNKGREAHLYLSDFAGLIRKVLQNSEKEEVSLAEELETVEQYLRLEKLRFDFNFQVTVSEGIDPHNTPVPSMLLQPFAENAVIHGLQNKEGERKLKIEVLKESEQSEHTRLAHQASKVGILIIIEDNGIGRAAAQNMGTNKNGKGSKLMQERLQILQEKQNEKYHLQITDLNENGATGTRVEIWVPEEK